MATIKKLAGRPTDYTDELADEFCRRITSGRSVSEIVSDLDMPASATIYRWRQEKPDFKEKIACAREERLEAYSDRILALGQRVIEETDLDFQRVNSAVNAIDKAARLQKPKEQRVELTGKDGGPIETVEHSPRDLAKALLFALSGGKP